MYRKYLKQCLRVWFEKYLFYISKNMLMDVAYSIHIYYTKYYEAILSVWHHINTAYKGKCKWSKEKTYWIIAYTLTHAHTSGLVSLSKLHYCVTGRQAIKHKDIVCESPHSLSLFNPNTFLHTCHNHNHPDSPLQWQRPHDSSYSANFARFCQK